MVFVSFFGKRERLACCRAAVRWVYGWLLGGMDSKPLKAAHIITGKDDK